MKANAGEVYTVYNQYLKRYTACQVAYIAPPDSVSKQPWAVILSLDWVGDAPLTAEELPHLRPLYKDFMYWSRDLHLLRVPLEVPPQYKLVGTLPSFTDQPCRSYGGWSDGYDVYLQIRWQAIPEERRRAFKEAAESDGVTEIGGIPVKVSSHRIMDQHEPFDSALELRALPCLSDLICERWHPDLLEFLRETPFVDEVTLLNHGQRTLDLRGTSIRKLMLDMTGLEELWLCEGTELLLFQNKGPDACAIHAPEDGSGLTLQFIGEYRPHTELPNLRGLHGIELKDFDLTGLAAVHPHPGADAGASLVLDDQPAGDGGKSGKAALEKQAGNGSADHQTPETGVAGAKSGQSLPGLGRRRTYPCRRREKGSQSIPQDPLPADEAGRRTGRGCPGPGAGRGGRLHPDLQQDGLHRNRETG